MNRTISTAALFATALLMTGCLDPIARRKRPAHVDTRTYMDRGADRRQADRDDDQDDDAPDDASADATPPPPELDQPAPPTKVAPPEPTGPVPYAIKAPGKPGFVTSPFAEGKLIDVRGLPPGTEFECPYTKRPIQVP